MYVQTRCSVPMYCNYWACGVCLARATSSSWFCTTTDWRFAMHWKWVICTGPSASTMAEATTILYSSAPSPPPPLPFPPSIFPSLPLPKDAVLAQIKWTKDQSLADNAEWANSDKPVLLVSSSVVRVWDISLKQCHAPMSTNRHCEPFFCPHSVLPHMALRLKTLLQHQPWATGEYSLAEKL